MGHTQFFFVLIQQNILPAATGLTGCDITVWISNYCYGNHIYRERSYSSMLNFIDSIAIPYPAPQQRPIMGRLLGKQIFLSVCFMRMF